jgi:hypothetical protein
MIHRLAVTFGALFALALNFALNSADAQSAAPDAHESIWLEAEHFEGVRGYCWPMGRPEMKQTNGHWGLSGPGWAAEWNMGGESNFLSIATGAEDDRAAVSKPIEIPADGRYYLWVRYGDWREQPEQFEVVVEQPGAAAWTTVLGTAPVIEEDNELKLYFTWAFGWGRGEGNLKRGPAVITVRASVKQPQPRQVDVVVLTTDPNYRPHIKDRPAHPSWNLLAEYRKAGLGTLAPLSRAAERGPSLAAAPPPAWQVKTFADRGFQYLWNVSAKGDNADWLGDGPGRILFPYGMRDPDALVEFQKTYGGRGDVPIFSDPRVAPAFHGVGPGIFATDPETGELKPEGQQFARWLDANPNRMWGMMMNYHPGEPVGPKGWEAFAKYRARYLGSIAGESLGYFDVPQDKMRAATASAQTRRQLVEAFSPLALAANAEKYRAIYGRDLDPNPYLDVISCMSMGQAAFTPLCYLWGARTVGYESTASTWTLLGMRWAFLRGAARQFDGLTATYRSCNFGDSATMFSNSQSYHTPQNILDNYYSVYSGAGMTWYKFDIWYQYMAGASLFYHEQGFDEFWRPGGTAAAGIHPIQLSPKGKLVDRFLRLTAAQPERGVPWTPVAFLLDYAHGWEPTTTWPNSFENFHRQEDRFKIGDHEQMLSEYFAAAYYPIGPESERPLTGTNEAFVPGIFGDTFDVIYATPDVSRWRTIDTYPVVIVAGDIELTAAEGQRLSQYVDQGGTLLVAEGQLSGPGAMALAIPASGEVKEANHYRWLSDGRLFPAQRFRFRTIQPGGNWRPLATGPEGDWFCAAQDRGQGRLVYLSVSRGLGIDRRSIPVVPRLLAHLTRGLMPIEVDGDVQWLVNKTPERWLVTLLNPAGQIKPQQGITPTDYRENRRVVIRSRGRIKSAVDRLAPSESLNPEHGELRLEVPAGGVRIVELNVAQDGP